MARYIGLPILILAAILDATLMAELRVGGGGPDLVFLLVISWALLADVQDALLWAVFGGVVKDVLSVAPLGASALGLVLLAYAVDSLFGDVRRTNVIIPPLVMGVGTAVYHAVLLLVLRLDGHIVPLSDALLYVTVPAMVYNVLLSVPVFRLIGLIHDWLSPRRVRLE